LEPLDPEGDSCCGCDPRAMKMWQEYFYEWKETNEGKAVTNIRKSSLRLSVTNIHYEL